MSNFVGGRTPDQLQAAIGMQLDTIRNLKSGRHPTCEEERHLEELRSELARLVSPRVN